MVNQVLSHKVDKHYGSVHIDAEFLPDDPLEFSSRLSHSLRLWRDTGRAGIWLCLPVMKTHLLPHALKHLFELHHAQKEYVMLCKWLPATPSKLPAYASNYVGVGGLVVNQKNEVLVIQERFGGLKGSWKLPGGAANVGESLSDAAVREVFEETGIRTTPGPCLFLRQLHGFRFNQSDIYFAFRLNPIDSHASMDPIEIKACQWMPLEEFEALGSFKTLGAIGHHICVQHIRGHYSGLDSVVLGGSRSGYAPPLLYHACHLNTDSGEGTSEHGSSVTAAASGPSISSRTVEGDDERSFKLRPEMKRLMEVANQSEKAAREASNSPSPAAAAHDDLSAISTPEPPVSQMSIPKLLRAKL